MRHRSLSAIEFAKSNICFLYKTRVPSSPRPSNELAQSLGGRNSTCGAVLRSNAILFPVPRNFACNSLANGVNCPHFDGTLLILPSESWLYSSSLSRWSLTHGAASSIMNRLHLWRLERKSSVWRGARYSGKCGAKYTVKVYLVCDICNRWALVTCGLHYCLPVKLHVIEVEPSWTVRVCGYLGAGNKI